MEEKDAVIVGARCAGSTLAAGLAERGWDVLLVHRDSFPSDTVSTHMMFPSALAGLERLGLLDRLRERHELAPLEWRTIGLGHETAGGFTAVDGFDRCLSVRRTALDKAFVDTALAAGAEGRFGKRVVGLARAGTGGEPFTAGGPDGGGEGRGR